jgi:hypothetical protein
MARRYVPQSERTPTTTQAAHMERLIDAPDTVTVTGSTKAMHFRCQDAGWLKGSTVTPAGYAAIGREVPAAPVADAAPTCEHRTGQTGCDLKTCQGVPVGVDIVHAAGPVAAEPVAGETGAASYERDMVAAMRRYGLTVSIPTLFASQVRPDARYIDGCTFTANGHGVSVVKYESRGPLDTWPKRYGAVYVGEQIISSEQPLTGGAANVGHAIAYAVARHVETLPAETAGPVVTVADAAKVAPVTQPADAASDTTDPAPVAVPVRGQRAGYGRRVTRTITNRRAGECDTCGQTVEAGRGEARLLDTDAWIVVHPSARWEGSPVSGGYVGGCPDPAPVADMGQVATPDTAPDAGEVDRSAVADDMWLRARMAWDNGRLSDVVTMINAGEAYRPGHAVPHHGTWSGMLAAVLAEVEAAHMPDVPATGEVADPAPVAGNRDSLAAAAEVRAHTLFVAGDYAGALAAVTDGECARPGYLITDADGHGHGWNALRDVIGAAMAAADAGRSDTGDGSPVAFGTVAEVEQATIDGGADRFPDAPSVAVRTMPAAPPAVRPVQDGLFADIARAERENLAGQGALLDVVMAVTPDARPVTPPDYAALAEVDSDALVVAVLVAAETDTPDVAELARLSDACDLAQAREIRAARVDELIGRGWSVAGAVAEVDGRDPGEVEREDIAARIDVDRRQGETRAQTVRRLYDAATAERHDRAETDCCGHMLSAAGRAARVSPRSLFYGPEWRVAKYGSPELIDWFTAHGRLTVGQWREQCGTVARPVSARPASVPDTAADMVAGWDADESPAPVSPAPAGVQAVPVPVAPVAVPVDDCAMFAYAAGTAVRAVLKSARREVADVWRAAPSGDPTRLVSVSMVPDRDAHRVAVTATVPAGVDAAWVWAVVAEVAARHGLSPAAVPVSD